MRAVALLLLCSCAAGPASLPSSLPYVRIDPALSGAVISREAAEALTIRRRIDRLECDQRVTDCQTTTTILRHRAEEAEKRAANAVWWQTYGPGLLGGGVVSALLLGAATAFLVLGAVK